MLFRDDDICVYTPYDEFRAVHSMFVAAKQVHTIGIVVEDIWLNGTLWNYLLTAPYLEWALHGWEHVPHNTDPNEGDLDKALTVLNTRTAPGAKGARTCEACILAQPNEVRYFFPPFNKTGVKVHEWAAKRGLAIDTTYGESPSVFAFHYWEVLIYPSVRRRLEELLHVAQ